MAVKRMLIVAVAAMLLPAIWAVGQSGAPGRSAPPQASSQTPAAAKDAPHAASRQEWEAYRSAAEQSDPAKLEAQAIDFAQKFPASRLRAYLFQRAMALYARANNSTKSLQMARAVLNYDPENPAALVTAAQILANGARESDLDRDGRLEEARGDALHALRNLGRLNESSGLSPEQIGDLSAQLSGAAHEALGTVAFKRKDFPTALKEYNIAALEQKAHADPVVWLRLSVAYEKTGNLPLSSDAAEKAMEAAAPGSRARELAERQKAHIEKKSATDKAEENAASPAAPAPAGASVKF